MLLSNLRLYFVNKQEEQFSKKNKKVLHLRAWHSTSVKPTDHRLQLFGKFGKLVCTKGAQAFPPYSVYTELRAPCTKHMLHVSILDNLDRIPVYRRVCMHR